MKSMPDKFKKSVSKAKENETSKKVLVKGSKANHPAVKKVPRSKAESKPVENPLKTFSGYCICDKPERDDMIGCDFCDAWYHPECIGIDQKEVLQVTQNQSWKCPKCIEEDLLKKRKLSKSAPVKAIKKFVKKVIPSGKKSTPTKSRPKKVLNYKDDSSSSDTD